MATRPLQMLSGAEIVDRGRIVSNCILPEVGTKEVAPNGSWLEAKQIQTALEKRKSLVAAERIDKVGALSHAEWRDELKLAEVTQQVGGHWKYMGHNVNGTFFLAPEEALFLIETNCLLLKHNRVTVSLQKAYSLLLEDNTSLTQYKVYAYLSRVGYKVFRHIKPKPTDVMESDESSHPEKSTTNLRPRRVVLCDTALDLPSNNFSNVVIQNNSQVAIYVPFPSHNMAMNQPLTETLNTPKNTTEPMDCDMEFTPLQKKRKKILDATKKSTKDNVRGTLSIDELGVIRSTVEEIADIEMTTASPSTQTDKDKENQSNELNKPEHLNIYQITKNILKTRKIKLTDPKILEENFKDVPECYDQQVISTNVPKEELLPRNIYLNNTFYVLNVKNLTSNNRSKPESRVHPRQTRVSNDSENSGELSPDIPQYVINAARAQRIPDQRFCPFPRHPYYHLNFIRHFDKPSNNIRCAAPKNQKLKQRRKVKQEHLKAIKNLAHKLKMLPKMPANSIHSLHGLVARFNEIYREKITISRDFNIVSDDSKVETIDLDEDDVQTSQPVEKDTKFDEYLESIKKLAARLKNMERKNQSVLRQKKALNELLKKYNEKFDAELYLDAKGEVKDNRLVVLDSSSDSEVVATEHGAQTNTKRKSDSDDNNATKNKKRKLFNPFNILKKVNAGASTSRADENLVPVLPTENNTEALLKYFDKKWLPDDDDFGKASFCSKMDTRHLLSNSQQLYDFVDASDMFENWIDLKISFCDHMEEVSAFEQHLNTEHSNDLTTGTSTIKSILVQDPNDDCASMEKLRIIKTATDVQETSLTIDFDVYNRDVQNFRKKKPPKPHFRVVCVDESSKFPSGAEVRAVHGRCDDNVNIVFAVVGFGSISYLQMNPKDLPINLGND